MRRILVGALACSVVIALVSFAVIWAFDNGDEASQSGVQVVDSVVPDSGDTSALGLKGIVQYTIWDGNGRVKDSGVINNAVNDEGLNETFNRIASTATGGAYDAITAMSVDSVTDDPADGIVAGSISLTLDGDSGTGGNQNPADGNVTTDFGTETGNGSVAVTFTAQADGVDVKQIVLTKAAEDDTSDGAVAIADGDIFSYVDVPDIVLNTNDTVQYTWTIDVD